MSVTYVMARALDKRQIEAAKTERANLHEELATMLAHLNAFGVLLESIVIDPTTGAATVTLSDKVPRAQMEHVGISPASEAVKA